MKELHVAISHDGKVFWTKEGYSILTGIKPLEIARRFKKADLKTIYLLSKPSEKFTITGASLMVTKEIKAVSQDQAIKWLFGDRHEFMMDLAGTNGLNGYVFDLAGINWLINSTKSSMSSYDIHSGKSKLVYDLSFPRVESLIDEFTVREAISAVTQLPSTFVFAFSEIWKCLGFDSFASAKYFFDSDKGILQEGFDYEKRLVRINHKNLSDCDKQLELFKYEICFTTEALVQFSWNVGKKLGYQKARNVNKILSETGAKQEVLLRRGLDYGKDRN